MARAILSYRTTINKQVLSASQMWYVFKFKATVGISDFIMSYKFLLFTTGISNVYI